MSNSRNLTEPQSSSGWDRGIAYDSEKRYFAGGGPGDAEIYKTATGTQRLLDAAAQ